MNITRNNNTVTLSKDQTYYWLQEDKMLRPDMSVPSSVHHKIVSYAGFKKQVSFIVGTFVDIMSGSRHRVPLHELMLISVPSTSTLEPYPAVVEIINGKVISYLFCCEKCRDEFVKTHKMDKSVQRHIRPKTYTNCIHCCKMIGSLI
jgi:hypothetical protein